MGEAPAASGLWLRPRFFFGTLMDQDVVRHVLARPVAPSEFEPAVLEGYVPRRVRNASYPVLRPEPEGWVEGCLFRLRSEDERRRIDHFESEEYDLVPITVEVPDRGPVPAALYWSLEDVLEPVAEPWSFARWHREEKRDLLARCDEWMADYEP